MKENVASFVCASSEEQGTEEEAKKLRGRIIDFPGHPSLRGYAQPCFVTE